ncbi:DUF736 family protein [Phyllobacterium sophorae]|uniref:DUF736 family protein n=1 Tax=Phyllobacterium sophorae TaxID=1520277 RepID=UPI00267EB28B
MADMTNYIRFNGDELSGNLASLNYDIDVIGERFHSDNEKAPLFRLFGSSPRGRKIEIGGIWQKVSQKEKPYYTLSVNTGFGKINANLGR